MSEGTLGGYRILAELGRGAMGVVYHGLDPQIGRPVAIKRIRVEAGASPEQGVLLRQRLVREASAAGKLSHPGIVTVYHLGEDGSDIFIVMEYVAGTTLERALHAGGLDLRRRLDILRQVAAALDYAHRWGVVHRDIKPGNILIREDGAVKIADFGIAKMTQQMTLAENLTTAGASLGSPAYMSPEQVRAAQVDHRSDQFSLGVLAYQMLSGRMPFTAENPHALLFQILSADPFSTQPDALPPAVAAALAPALAKEPGGRYASCTALVDALSAAAGEPASHPAAPPAAAPRVPAPTQSKNSMLPLLAVAAATLLIAVAGAGWYWMSKKKTASGESPEAPLVKAAQTGKADELKRLLADGESIDQADGEGTTALMALSEGTPYLANTTPLVSLLLEKGARVGVEDKRGRTALCRAAANGKIEAIRLLLERKADPNHKDSQGSTPLLQAVQYGHPAVIPVLIAGGAQVELEDASHTRPLMIAAEGTPYMANNAPLVKALLDHGADPSPQDERGRTALHRAASEGKEQAMRMLIEKKANVDQQANDGSTPLLAAVTHGKAGAVKILLEAGAAVDLADANGNTPLLTASEGTPYMADNKPLVAALLGSGAKVSVVDSRGRSALHRASSAGKTDAQQLLLDHKADPNQKANDGSTPLSEAVTYGKLESARLLLTRGAGVDIADGNGTTPLMIAAESTPYIKNPEEFVTLLLERRARKDLKDGRGRTALIRAEEANKQETIRLLR